MRERHKRASVRVSKDKVTKKEESCLNLASLPESQLFWGSHSTLDTCQSCAAILLSLLTATIPTASGFV